MINTEKSFNIHDYTEIFLRRIWYIVIPFTVIMVAAVLYAFSLPKMYSATTLILVTPQKVPDTFVRPTVTSRIEDRLQSIGQEIMSRTRLEQVISEFKLYSEEAKSLSGEEIIELMRKNVQVEIKGKEGYFTISYIGKDPRTVTMVTNKLASLFIEENLKLREQQAQGTSEFLSIELNAMRTKLEEQEGAITRFKKQFMTELPEQRDANLRILEQLQLQYQKIGDNLKAAQDRKLIIQKQLSDMKIQMALGSPSGNPENPKEERTDTTTLSDLSQPPLPKQKAQSLEEAQLNNARSLLSELKSKYTERHPDIVRIERYIAEKEKSIEKMKAQDMGGNLSGSETSKKKKDDGKMEMESNPFYQEMESQLVAAELEVKKLKEEDSKIKARIAEFQARVENTPVRELAMTSLTRDYQNTKETYQSLLKKNQEAQQAENLERRQKGEQFKVIDPARIPEKPMQAKVFKILLAGLLLGMGSGLGMAFLREQMDRSFRDAEDLEATVEFKVLANIPRIQKKAA
jgi:polysaccharide chain length determinant protein (PEP-CTERM system associated)